LHREANKSDAINDEVFSSDLPSNNVIDADPQEEMDLLVGSTQLNFIPFEGDEESYRAFLLQELSYDRRGYDESHIRIKRKNNKGNDEYKQGGDTRELELCRSVKVAY